MQELIVNYTWAMLGLAVLLGAVLGSLITMWMERRKNKGQTVAGLAEELDEYRDTVSEHFSTTSELFRDLTEKYRDVYNHLASGSEALCKNPIEHGQLEFRPPKALEAQADAQDIPRATGDTSTDENTVTDQAVNESPANESLPDEVRVNMGQANDAAADMSESAAKGEGEKTAT